MIILLGEHEGSRRLKTEILVQFDGVGSSAEVLMSPQCVQLSYTFPKRTLGPGDYSNSTLVHQLHNSPELVRVGLGSGGVSACEGALRHTRMLLSQCSTLVTQWCAHARTQFVTTGLFGTQDRYMSVCTPYIAVLGVCVSGLGGCL